MQAAECYIQPASCVCLLGMLLNRHAPAAQEAAREKAQAGEGRNVEHLAEVDDAVADFIEKQKGTTKRQRQRS